MPSGGENYLNQSQDQKTGKKSSKYNIPISYAATLCPLKLMTLNRTCRSNRPAQVSRFKSGLENRPIIEIRYRVRLLGHGGGMLQKLTVLIIHYI